MAERIKLKGRLHYLGWSKKPWKLVTDNSRELDLWPHVEGVLKSLNGKRAGHKKDRESYILKADETLDFRLEYKPGEAPLLIKEQGFGGFNVCISLDRALVWLSGRLVEIEFGDGYFNIHANPSERILGVYFTGRGNSCKIPVGAENTVCKIRQGKEACIFPSFSAGGWFCEKFSGPMASLLLDRIANRRDVRRIGNCTVLGRKDS